MLLTIRYLMYGIPWALLVYSVAQEILKDSKDRYHHNKNPEPLQSSSHPPSSIL
jgi:hypothetical protein